ncbi:hypothetical protein [Burkholderia vietnamiensis]|uniref:hypothetical protein n=1 Tax=Burkholderia vietnamiensis TaxID=60552 RepID=UPI001E38ED57|nr:hypothetical protein [Burkholderia vietnamiensis]
MRQIVGEVNAALLNGVFANLLNMVFNSGMDKTARIEADRIMITRLGGPARVAELLGYERHQGGTQRVCNWLARGIPAAVKVERPDLFLVALSTANPTDAH